MSGEHLRHLYDTLDFLSSVRETNDIKIWSRIMEKAAVAVGAEAAVYRYYDTLAKKLVAFHVLGTDANAGDLPPVNIGEGLSGWVGRFKEPLIAKDWKKEKRLNSHLDGLPGREPRTALVLPLLIELDFVGTLSLYDKSAGSFDEEDLKLARTILIEASHTIRRLRLEDMVNRVTTYNASILDNLSGGFFAVDLQGRVMICNPAARRILSIEGEVTDLPVEKVLTHIPQLAALLRETVHSKKTLKRQDLTWTYQSRDRILGYSTLLIQDTKGELTGAGITFQDITNIKK